MMPWPSCVWTAIIHQKVVQFHAEKTNVFLLLLFASLDLHIISIAIEEGQRNSGLSNDHFTLRNNAKQLCATFIYSLFAQIVFELIYFLWP